MSIYDARIQEEWQEEYNRKLNGEYYTVNSEKEPTDLSDTVEYQMYHRKDYEFVEVKPFRRMIYKYHPIKTEGTKASNKYINTIYSPTIIILP